MFIGQKLFSAISKSSCSSKNNAGVSQKPKLSFSEISRWNKTDPTIWLELKFFTSKVLSLLSSWATPLIYPFLQKFFTLDLYDFCKLEWSHFFQDPAMKNNVFLFSLFFVLKFFIFCCWKYYIQMIANMYIFGKIKILKGSIRLDSRGFVHDSRNLRKKCISYFLIKMEIRHHKSISYFITLSIFYFNKLLLITSFQGLIAIN